MKERITLRESTPRPIGRGRGWVCWESVHWAHLAFFFLMLFPLSVFADHSVAGLFPLEGSGRVIYNFNQGWRFHRGDVQGAAAKSFNDEQWEVVCAPHTAMLVPSEASGCRNYQGIVWYRKHFTVPADMQGKNVTVYFEAIMGRQEIYVNGQKVKDNKGGYLPISINLTEAGVNAGDDCLIAVMADNSDDNTYPPGKKQTALDFAYHGGMYRDVWLIGKSPVAITDPNEMNQVAGGGIFLHYDNISEKSAEVFINVNVKADPPLTLPMREGAITAEVVAKIKTAEGKLLKTLRQKLTLQKGEDKTALLSTTLKNPHLWSPEDPYLYNIEIIVTAPSLIGRAGGGSLAGGGSDGGLIKAGIRKAEFRGKDGFWLNGKPYGQLIGGNRHQDFALVGNALPNSQQWRDAKRLKDAGMNIIRAAHYPQDPSFMDALDELGIFIIVPTPGWQYWNKDEYWAELVHENTRQIIRRDRNHPSVLMWEPILNETRYPEDFALKALQITREEFPYPGRPVAAADMNSAGVKDNYDVLYGWPEDVTGPVEAKGSQQPTITYIPATQLPDKCIFTREFGEMVDDWYAHNCLNRAARGWGEKPMLTAALSLAETYGTMRHGQRQFIGGCLWHPFDHQRGYHPDPYYGGIYDAFRQKKYAFEMFHSQIPPSGEVGRGVFIAHEMTPFSDNDVVVFSNCDSVRLSFLEGDRQMTLPVVHDPNGLSNAPVVFPHFWDFWEAREYSYKKREWQHVSLLAEGIIDGKVVVTEKKMPSRRSTNIRLYADEMDKKLVADGSDFIVVVAEITDDNGNVRRLAKDQIVFTVEGEGHIIGDASIAANPRAVEWGSAPILVQSTNRAGKITITAHSQWPGTYAPTADTLTIESIPYEGKMCYKEEPTPLQLPRGGVQEASPRGGLEKGMTEEEKRRTLLEVEQQQKDFGIQ